TALALDIARRRSAGLSSTAYPAHLVGIVSRVPDQALTCFTALLSLRALQLESIAAQKRTEGRRFSETSIGRWTSPLSDDVAKTAVEQHNTIIPFAIGSLPIACGTYRGKHCVS